MPPRFFRQTPGSQKPRDSVRLLERIRAHCINQAIRFERYNAGNKIIFRIINLVLSGLEVEEKRSCRTEMNEDMKKEMNDSETSSPR